MRMKQGMFLWTEGWSSSPAAYYLQEVLIHISHTACWPSAPVSLQEIFSYTAAGMCPLFVQCGQQCWSVNLFCQILSSHTAAGA